MTASIVYPPPSAAQAVCSLLSLQPRPSRSEDNATRLWSIFGSTVNTYLSILHFPWLLSCTVLRVPPSYDVLLSTAGDGFHLLSATDRA